MLPLKRRKLHLHLTLEQRLAAADESESLRLKQAATLKAKKDQRRGGDGRTTARDNEEEHRLQSTRTPTDVISGRWVGKGRHKKSIRGDGGSLCFLVSESLWAVTTWEEDLTKRPCLH